jgi:uncharacterized protein YvpB
MDFFTLTIPFEITVFSYFLTLIGTAFFVYKNYDYLFLPEQRINKLFSCLIITVLFSMNIANGFSIVRQISSTPQISQVYPSQNTTINPITKAIRVSFTTPVDFRKLKVHTYPETKSIIRGSGYFGNLLPFGRTFSIIPDISFPNDQKIMVYLSDIASPFTRKFGGEKLLKFQTAGLPVITEIIPPDNSSDVAVNSTISLKLSVTPSSSHWTVISNPPHPLSWKMINNSTLQINPDIPFRQGTSYIFSVTQIPVLVNPITGIVKQELDPIPAANFILSTSNSPFIKSFSPLESAANPNDNFRITFDQPMSRASVEQSISITPQVNKTFYWEADSSILKIKPEGLNYDTSYTLMIKKGATTSKGTTLETDIKYNIHTAGPLKIISSIPTDQEKAASVSGKIQVIFDQEIQPGIANKFSISPSVKGIISVIGKTLSFNPDQPLNFNTRYTLNIASGSSSLYGLSSTNNTSISFITKPSETILTVPFFIQQDDFTCNIAAARMLLAYRQIFVSETELKNIIGISGNRDIGNPHKGYVSGYGTYWEPIFQAMTKYRPARLITGGKLDDVIKEIIKGNPIMIWGQNGWSDPHDISWTSNDGTHITAINGMHSSVVRGFRGPENNPTQILLNDPWRGQYMITTKEFLRRWSYFSVALVID